MAFPCKTCCRSDGESIQSAADDRAAIAVNVSYALGNITALKQWTEYGAAPADADTSDAGGAGVSLGTCVGVAVLVSCFSNVALLMILKGGRPQGSTEALMHEMKPAQDTF